MKQGVVLAAGRGQRLQPLTQARSKAMLPIVGKPMVERVMDELALGGVRDFILVVSPDDRRIVQYFSGEARLDARVRFVHQPQPLGAGDALCQAAPLINGDFVLAACDNLFPPGHVRSMIARWAEQDVEALLTLMPVTPDEARSAGVVALDGSRVTRIVEKPAPGEAPSNIASLPLYIFSPRLLAHLADLPPSPRGEYELQDAIQRLIDEGGRVRGLPVEWRLTLTRPADLLAINRRYLGHGAPRLAQQSVGPNTQLVPPLHIEEGTIIGANCVIGPNVVIERDCQVGDGATIREAVLLAGVRVPAGGMITEQVMA